MSHLQSLQPSKWKKNSIVFLGVRSMSNILLFPSSHGTPLQSVLNAQFTKHRHDGMSGKSLKLKKLNGWTNYLPCQIPHDSICPKVNHFHFTFIFCLSKWGYANKDDLDSLATVVWGITYVSPSCLHILAILMILESFRNV